MKSIVIFYDDDKSKYKNDKVFDGFSAVEKAGEWAKKINPEGGIVTLSNAASVKDLLTRMKDACSQNGADYVIFSYNDLPFLNEELTNKLISAHLEYKAEYTFADGYPYGFTPEIVDAGTLGILLEMVNKSEKEEPVSREGIYSVIKTDINSFEVEVVLAPEDWRLYRYAFHCGNKEHFLCCKELCTAGGNINQLASDYFSASAEELSKLACKVPGILKSVPAFYNLQISDFSASDLLYSPYNKEYEKLTKQNPVNVHTGMNYEKFCSFMEKAAEFSEEGVVGLSLWGEPLANDDCLKIIEKVLSYSGFSVFFETDGLLVTQDFCQKLSQIEKNAVPRTNGWAKIMASVQIDSFSEQTYKLIHKNSQDGAFSKAVQAVSLLAQNLEEPVYPSFVRMNENEDDLEGFFRYWNEKSNPSKGQLIIQKYDDFSGLLPPSKPADLAPLERNICWHLRRDMNVLSNGDVTVCRGCVFENKKGNVFEDSLEEIWKSMDEELNEHISGKYCEKCRKCDEYYTYNF